MNNRKVINNSCYNSYLLFLCSPKEKKQKERAFAAVEKNPVHNARQLAERRNRRCGRMQSQACLGYAEPRGEKDAKHLNSQHRSAPLPCYGRRIFFITPQVCDMTLTTCEIQRLQQWQDATLSSEVPPCNLLFSFLCFVSFFFSGRRKKERNEGKNFYYHTNHLGSTAFVTDQNQNVTQGFLYAPFGEITTEYAPLWQNGTLPKYSFNAKELDEETGMYYYEARYYKPPVFTSRDAMFEKYFWMTPYAYCANNPVKYVDPSGCEFGDYYDENGNWVFNDGINDGRIYVEDQENGVFMGPLKQPLYRQVGTVTSVELTFTGEATNSKNKDNVDISKAEGTLSMIQHCDDGNDYVRFSFDATSGDYGNGSLENGQYSVGKGWRRSEKGYLQHDFGFCFPIIPGFETDRSELLIHPDGNKPGTKGCIGINSDLFGLKDFYKTMNLIIDNYGNIPLTVDILNNVNNNGSKSSTNKLNE